MSSTSTPTMPSPLAALPRNVATSILSYTTSDDWLSFRLASRSCYELVHGTAGASSTSGNEESDDLWKIALVNDYHFDPSADDTLMRQCFHFNTENDDFLSTQQHFTASNSFESWKHWRKLDCRFHHRR